MDSQGAAIRALWVRRALASIDRFLLALGATVVLAVLAPASGGFATVVEDLATWLVAVIFFLYGARLSPEAVVGGLRGWRVQLGVAAGTFVVAPALGAICHLLGPAGLAPGLTTGLVYLMLLPSTVQSSIALTSIARGNIPAAITAASLSNLAGVVLTPVLAGFLLGSAITVSAGSVVRLLAQVALPFALGQLLRPRIGHMVTRFPRVLSLIDRSSVLVVVYSAFGSHGGVNVWSQTSLGEVLVVLAVDVMLLGAMLGLTRLMGRLLELSRPDWIVVMLCGSKKSIATGIPMAAVLFPSSRVGLVVLPAIFYHQIQLVVCTIIAGRLGRQEAAENQATAVDGAAGHAPSLSGEDPLDLRRDIESQVLLPGSGDDLE